MSQELARIGSLVTLSSGKKDITATASEIAKRVVNEDGNVLEFDAYLRKIELFVKTFRDTEEFKAAVFKEVEAYKEVINRHGIEFEIAAAGVSYDYSGDDIWSDLKKRLEERQEFLKGFIGNSVDEERVDPETGEVSVVKVFGARKKGGFTVKGTIKN